ncbi:MAG: CopD family protein [Gammaproteobacteria bacterium]|nr:CopD family protein [Gammaproteobacteria bacterium]
MYQLLLVLHVLGATIWVGGHLVLSLAILPRALRTRNPSIILEFESAYERIGIPALLVQVVTGLMLAHHWVPEVESWLSADTPLTRLIFVKLALLAATVVLGAHARLRIIPRLNSDNLPLLAYHVVTVTLLGVAFLVAGAAFRTGGVN